MLTPEKAMTACASAAAAHAAAAEWDQAVQHTVRSLIERLALANGLAAPELPRPHMPDAETALDEMGPLDGWHLADVGEVHQRLLAHTATRHADGTITVQRGAGKRFEQGSWYTPPQLATDMCRLTIGPQLDRLAQHPDPGNMLQVLAMDPACGAGVFLVEAARLIAGRFAARVCGMDPAPDVLVRAAMPTVMRECIFGVDIDPVAIDLAKTAVWIETGGRAPFTFMDRNIIVGNALNDEMPPAFSEARGEPVDNEERREWYAAQRQPEPAT